MVDDLGTYLMTWHLLNNCVFLIRFLKICFLLTSPAPPPPQNRGSETRLRSAHVFAHVLDVIIVLDNNVLDVNVNVLDVNNCFKNTESCLLHI